MFAFTFDLLIIYQFIYIMTSWQTRAKNSIIITFLLVISLIPEVKNWCLETTFNTGSQITASDYSPNGRYIALGFASGLVRFYSGINYAFLISYNNGVQRPNSISFSGDGNYVAIAYTQQNVIILNGSYPFALNRTLNTGHGGNVIEVDFSDNSALLLSCGNDGKFNTYTVGVWTPTTTSTTVGGGAATTCDFASNGNIGYANANNLAIYSSALGTLMTDNSRNYHHLRFVPGGSSLLFLNSNDRRGYYTPVSPKSIGSIITDSSIIGSLSYSRTSNYFGMGSQSNQVYIFNGTSNNNMLLFQWNMTNQVNAMDFSDDGLKLVAGDRNGVVNIFMQSCGKNCPPEFYYSGTTCTLCNATLIYCINCANQSVCDSCLQGYYVDPNLYTCRSCSIYGCSSCISSYNCTQCRSGYYLNGIVCTPCSTPIEGCQICNSSSICIECQNDYYLTGSDRCANCTAISNCQKCFNSSVCISCKDGFFVSGGGSCTACSSNCLVCTSTGTNCSQCVKGYFVNPPTSYTCTLCQTGCLSCNATNFCFQCLNSMYEKADGTCANCTLPCLQCLDATTCQNCLAGYYLSGTTCQVCINNCLTCNSSTYCTACKVGYHLTATNTCKFCPETYPFCETCGSSACTYCALGFFLNSTPSCQQCSSVMFKCTKCSSTTSCQSCLVGFYLGAGSGNSSCVSCPAGCQTCNASNYCQKCYQQYFLDGTNNCLPCSNNCTQCYNSTDCRVCDVGYYVDTNLCYLCNFNIPGCLECLSKTQCLNCDLGYYLDGTNLCVRCTSGCVTCSSNSVCLTCQLGFYLSAGTTCTRCSQYCSQCNTSAYCTSCVTRFYLDVGTNTCKNCSLRQGCLTCTATKCLACQDGYFLDNSANALIYLCSLCLSTLEGCLTCSAINYCLSCEYGYYLDTGVNRCKNCSSINGCQDCSDSTTCSVCSIGYFLNTTSNKCQICKTGCTSCNIAGECFACESGYYISSTNCLVCSTSMIGCHQCNSSSLCLTCDNGYYFNSGSCSLCRSVMAGCMFCNNTSTCTFCQTGYYINTGNNKCNICSFAMNGCQTCNASNICLSCQPNYYLVGNTCTQCNIGLPGCISCANSSYCWQCQTGLYLTSLNKCQMCSSQNSGCISCGSNGVGGILCNQCQAGFYLDSTSNQCLACQQDGCEVCLQSDSTKCLTCNYRYYLSSQTCRKCNQFIIGCEQCSSGTICSVCQAGYYLNSTNKCDLCQNALQGCMLCQYQTGTLTCDQCKSTYVLNAANVCQTCYSILQGCSYCVNTSQCISCANGYFKNSSNVCQSCTSLTGCLICSDDVTCLYCTSLYFRVNSTCFKCSDSIQFCQTCLDGSVCLSCQSGYKVTATNDCELITVQGSGAIQNLKLVTEYVDQNTLKHILYTQQISYQSQSFDLTGQCNLFLTDYSQAQTSIPQIQLIIRAISWISPTQLEFITNNPTDLSSSDIKLTRRLLIGGSLNTGYSVTLQMTSIAVQNVLPDLNHAGGVTLDYSLNQPQFYASFLANYQTASKYYAIFGYIISVLLVINFGIKSYYAKSLNHHNSGEMISHFMAFKTIGIILYPIPFQMYYFCYGFKLLDIPWGNEVIGPVLGQGSDTVPDAIAMNYYTMSLSSTFLIALLVVLGLFILGKFFIKDKSSTSIKWLKYNGFIYNVFVFGLTFSSSLSLQGALYNPMAQFTISSIFYILGIIVLLLVICEAFYSIRTNKSQFYKARIIAKALLLSIAYNNPIYVFSSCIVTDCLLMFFQYALTQKQYQNWKLWVASNLILNTALLILFYAPEKLLSYYFAMALIMMAFTIQIYTHCNYSSQTPKQKGKQQRRTANRNPLKAQSKKINSAQNDTNNHGKGKEFNVWDINNDQQVDNSMVNVLENNDGLKQEYFQTKDSLFSNANKMPRRRSTRQNKVFTKQKKLKEDMLKTVSVRSRKGDKEDAFKKTGLIFQEQELQE